MSHKLGLTIAQQNKWSRASLALLLVLLVSGLTLVSIALWTDWDLMFADTAFDASKKIFPLRHAWITETFNHVILKRAFVALALVLLTAVLWDLRSPRAWSWLHRFRMRVVALSAVLVPSAISLLKQVSNSHCPWDLERYGGTEPYVRLFEKLPPGIAPGHCMPGGHASSALWMLAFAIFFVPYQLTRAAIALTSFLVLGIMVGWLQQLRGAHFLTHTLWSAWIALLIVCLITTCLDRWPTRRSVNNEGPLG